MLPDEGPPGHRLKTQLDGQVLQLQQGVLELPVPVDDDDHRQGMAGFELLEPCHGIHGQAPPVNRRTDDHELVRKGRNRLLSALRTGQIDMPDIGDPDALGDAFQYLAGGSGG